MCIRDRLTTYRRYDVGFVFQFYNLVQNLTALANVELASEICRDPLDPKETLRSVGLGAVSYTHLVVYKRQHLDKAAVVDAGEQQRDHDAKHRRTGLHPVSYTHLDVYKRQRDD